MKSKVHILFETVPALVSTGDTCTCSSTDSNSSGSSITTALNDFELPPKVVVKTKSHSRVTFGEVSFRSFPTTLGDHPDCNGPPVRESVGVCLLSYIYPGSCILSTHLQRFFMPLPAEQLTLEWDPVREETYNLEDYEARRAPRKMREALLLDTVYRRRMLRCFAGISEDELNEQMVECSRIRSQRERSRRSLSLKASMRLVLSKLSSGFVGVVPIKNQKMDRVPNRSSRFQFKTVTAKC